MQPLHSAVPLKEFDYNAEVEIVNPAADTAPSGFWAVFRLRDDSLSGSSSASSADERCTW